MIKKFSQFFAHLVAYGGFTIEDGIIYVWNDPNLFIPLNSYVLFQKELYKILGQEKANQLLYWLGKTNGKGADQVLINRFGLKPDQLGDFLSAAAQDGFGYCEFIKKPNVKNIKDAIIRVDSSIARFLRNETSKLPVDSYFLGLIAAGGEVLYNINVRAEEVLCVAKGDKECRFLILKTGKPESYEFFNKIKVDPEDLLEKSRKLYMFRKSHFKIFARREVKFGDGTLRFKGIQGVIFAERVFVLLDYILFKWVGKKYENMQEKLARSHIEEIYNPKILPNLQQKNISTMLDLLSIFGYGRFELLKISGKTIFIENKNNFYPQDYNVLFGLSKKSVDKFPSLLIKYLFFKYFGEMPSVDEVKCRAVHETSCLFKVVL